MNEVFAWRQAPIADFAVIGDPVGHSRSPRMHESVYRAMGLNYRYVAVSVHVGEVGPALDHLAALGYLGVNVTVPHKSAALEWAAKPDQLSLRIGAANTLDLRDGSATNTDAPGFLETLEPLQFSRASALILGAGGTARAIVSVLPSAGFSVSIWNRTQSKALSLAVEFDLVCVPEPTAHFDLLVNTTSAGLNDQSLPIDWTNANPKCLAYDLVYGKTPFLREAASHGVVSMDGKRLLVAQGALSLKWWLGIDPPREVMEDAIQ